MSKLTLKSSVLGSTALALTLATGFAAPAQAQPNGLYSGGGTFAEKVYRDIMNCYGSSDGGNLAGGLASPPATCNVGAPYRSSVEILYVGVGSGNGLTAYINHSPRAYNAAKKPDNPPSNGSSDLGQFYGTGLGSNWTPVSDTGTAFPKLSFSGSDDPIDVTKYGTYHTNLTGNGWGEIIQVPALVGAVAVPYKPAGTWTEHGKKPSGGGNSGLVDLSTNTLCAIYTGAITDWSNALITADNQGTQLGSGTIHPLYRAEGSGTTFLFVNGLINQCSHTAHPVPTSWQTSGGNSLGKSDNSWFLHLESAGIIGPGSPLPNFQKVSGSGGMKAATITGGTDGAIGYVSTDFVLPIDPAGPKAANLQTYLTVLNSLTPVYKAPTFKSANLIMSTVKAPLSTAGSCPTGSNTTPNPNYPATSPSPFNSADGICSHNPLNFGITNPTPTSASAYPIGGFTFVDLYTCYASSTDVNSIASTTAGQLGFWRWYFGSATENASKVKTALNANGFTTVPGSWAGAAKKLLTTDKKTKISVPGTANTGCAGVSGPGA